MKGVWYTWWDKVIDIILNVAFTIIIGSLKSLEDFVTDSASSLFSPANLII